MDDAPPDAPDDAALWYSKPEYCRVFRVSDSTIDRQVKQGRIIRRIEGRRSFFRPAFDATPDDPQEAMLKAIQRLAAALEEQGRVIASLEAKLDATGGVTRDAPRIAATTDAPDDPPPAAPRASWWRQWSWRR